MDTSSTTQVAQIMGSHWRSSGTCWTKSVRSGACMGKSTELGICSFIEHKDYSYRFAWMTSKWLERSRIWLPCGRNWWKMFTLTNKLHFLITYTWDALNVNVNRTKSSSMNTDKCLNHEFLLEQLKKLPGWEKPHTKTVAWSYDMGGHAQKMRWKTLRTGEQEDRATIQSLNSLLGWSPFQDRGTRVFTNCVEMFVLGTKW